MQKNPQIPLLFVSILIIGYALSSVAIAGERRVIVGFHQTSESNERTLVQRHKGKLKHQFKRIKALSAKLTDQAIAELQSDPSVAYIEEDSIVSAIEPEFGNSEYLATWGVSRIGSESVHTTQVKGAGVKVAVLDTGIDYTHPDLDNNYRGGINIIDPDLPAGPFDDSWNSHGTHVAGIIAAELDGNGVVGVAPQASLYAIKTLDNGGSGYLSDVIAGIEWAIANDIDIINMSLGLRRDSPALAEVCARAYEAGILLVAAAGNTGLYGLGEVLYPARYSTVIAVGATNPDDTLHLMSAVSPDVDLVAPGSNIYSSITYSGYNVLTGTSQASPHVAGVAALILSAGLRDLNGDHTINNQDLRLQLQNNTFDLGEPERDGIYGYGLVNAAAATTLNPAWRASTRKARLLARAKIIAQANCNKRGVRRNYQSHCSNNSRHLQTRSHTANTRGTPHQR